MLPYIFAISTVLTTIIGGALSIRHKNKLHLIISFTAGVVLSIAFLEALPELFHVVIDSELSLEIYLVVLLGAFLFFHTLEKLLTLHDAHEEDYAPHHHSIKGYVSAIPLIAHSLLDGLGIGLGFQLGNAVGVIIAIAVLAHDFSDGINTASIMMLNNLSEAKTKLIVLLDAVAPIFGVVIANQFEISPKFLATYLAIFTGFLIYIGAGALLPEAHSKEKASKVLPLMLAGALIGGIITFITGNH